MSKFSARASVRSQMTRPIDTFRLICGGLNILAVYSFAMKSGYPNGTRVIKAIGRHRLLYIGRRSRINESRKSCDTSIYSMKNK